MGKNVIAREAKQSSSGSPRALMVARDDVPLPLYAITPFTMLDFPGHTAAIIWFSGCNMRCAYCHNPQIVKAKGRGRLDQAMDFLEKRAGLLDGIVLSGGEATLYPGLPHFIQILRDMDYKIKLDTNGTRPELISNFLDQGWLDYVALDYKAPLGKYKSLTAHKRFGDFEQTLDMLCAQKSVPFEVRTTVHTNLLNEEDLSCIITDLDQKKYTGTFYIQNYCSDNDRPTLGCLPEQQRILGIEKLAKPENFTLEFRNF